MRRASALLLLFSLLLLEGRAAPATNRLPPSSNPEGQKLAADLRSLRPTEDLAVNGFLKIRDADGKRTRVPFSYRFISGDKGWQNIYEIQAGEKLAGEKLAVVHTEGGPNRYWLTRGKTTNGPSAEPVAFTGDQAMVPFAASDFWLADLGLEFLHWPEQRIVHEAKIKMRKSRPCQVLESINPRPNAAGYTRVRSWIDTKTGGVILAEAYGPDNKLLKEFEVGGLTKVNGQWELKDMDMRNAKTDSKTVLEFKYEQKAAE
jgi:hypothetical protein